MVEKGSTFFICPDAKAPPEICSLIGKYVAERKREGRIVYYPMYDNPARDPTGGVHFYENIRLAIENSTDIGFFHYNQFWKDSSIGQEFPVIALGMAFASKKTITLVNKESPFFVNPLPGDPFVFDIFKNVALPFATEKTLEDYKNRQKVNFYFELPVSRKLLFNFGMAFYLKKSISLINSQNVPQVDRNSISINNVLLALHNPQEILSQNSV